MAVAVEGSVVLNDEGEEMEIKKTTVGGVVSQGMLCDSRMLGWTGGAEGIAVQIPESVAIGEAPPATKPRPGGHTESSSSDLPPAPGLFEKKLTKEEKKKLAEEKRKARKAAKEAKKAAEEAAEWSSFFNVKTIYQHKQTNNPGHSNGINTRICYWTHWFFMVQSISMKRKCWWRLEKTPLPPHERFEKGSCSHKLRWLTIRSLARLVFLTAQCFITKYITNEFNGTAVTFFFLP